MREIKIPADHVQWAMDAARVSSKRWESKKGHYNNNLNSHFKGKLGELAVESYLLSANLKIDSHFRFAEREKLADIVIKVKGYNKVFRIEVKTWSAIYWADLGRCIAKNQLTDLQKKADAVIWCVTDLQEMMDTPAPVHVQLTGWSTIDDVAKAPVKFTGMDKMRKVENHQLAESDLRGMESFLEDMD